MVNITLILTEVISTYVMKSDGSDAKNFGNGLYGSSRGDLIAFTKLAKVNFI